MLRIFQLSENDPRLTSKTLKNFEVFDTFSFCEKKFVDDKRLEAAMEVTCRDVVLHNFIDLI